MPEPGRYAEHPDSPGPYDPAGGVVGRTGVGVPDGSGPRAVSLLLFRPVGPVRHRRDGLHRERGMAQSGTVKFFNAQKGYGFIKPDDGGHDIFVHITAVERSGLSGLNEGQRIAFDVEADKKGKGPKAVNLVVS